MSDLWRVQEGQVIVRVEDADISDSDSVISIPT